MLKFQTTHNLVSVNPFVSVKLQFWLTWSKKNSEGKYISYLLIFWTWKFLNIPAFRSKIDYENSVANGLCFKFRINFYWKFCYGMDWVPLNSKQTPSVQHKDHTFSAPKIPQFNKPEKLSGRTERVSWTGGFWCGTEGFLVCNWGMCWTDGFMVWNWGVCWTEGFLVWKWGIWGLKRSGPFVLSWYVELRGIRMDSATA